MIYSYRLRWWLLLFLVSLVGFLKYWYTQSMGNGFSGQHQRSAGLNVRPFIGIGNHHTVLRS